MARDSQRKRSAPPAYGERSPDQAPKRLQQMGQNTAQIVRDAALLLDEEIAAGIVTARQVEQRFRAERRIDPGDLQGALQRFRDDGHEIISVVDEQLTALRSDQNADVVKRFVESAHALLDVAVEAVTIGSEVAGQLSGALATDPAPPKQKRRTR